MTCCHAMPFGAALSEDGGLFRLWAPSAKTVDVVFEDSPPRLSAMSPVGGGWFEVFVPECVAGTLYRFRIDGKMDVPDPASRHQPNDVHAPSAVVDPGSYVWRHPHWRGRAWHEAVIYELHVGSFSPEGTFDGVRQRLDHLVDLGVTAIELMPIADFAGMRNWGYDGVLPFAPDSSYGTPDDLKRLVDDAHGRGLMMILDVVYNHFGPDGNYLHVYAPQFFTEGAMTPWGPAIDFARREVRDFFIHNALYWLEEYRFDGLRLDAVHAIVDNRSPDILEEIAETVRLRFEGDRQVHLVLENEHNAARRLERAENGEVVQYVAQWNDDIHHALHILATDESAAYYADFSERPLDHLARCLSEGFAYQGEPFRHLGGAPRGEPSAHLPATAFVSFIQNHDQIGNRAFGERISALADTPVLRALTAVMLLAPSPPLLFMGEEWGAIEPFLFFCDFQDDLADVVREGRRREFERFPEFRDPESRRRIPDPNDKSTFSRSALDWERRYLPDHAAWLEHYRALLRVRHRDVIPRLVGLEGHAATARRFGRGGLCVDWRLGDGSRLSLVANLADRESSPPPVVERGRMLFSTPEETDFSIVRDGMPPWSVSWFLTG